MWIFYTPCVSVAVSGDFCDETARKCTKFQNIHVSLLSFLPWTRPRLGGLNHFDTFTWQIVTPQGLFTWRWGTPGRWGNQLSRGRKIKRVYMQSCNHEVLELGFLRLLLCLQLSSLSRGVPSSHLEKDKRLILGHVRIYSWKRHALCYARNRWLNELYAIIWETKYSWFTTVNIPKCEHFTLLVCPLRFLAVSAMRWLGNVQNFKTYMFRFWAFCNERDPG